MNGKINLRPIAPRDDADIAQIVREVLTEFGANKPGFAWQDPELDYMSRAYANEGSVYWVAEVDGEVIGGAGIGPFNCAEAAVCELQKMYLRKHARGLGVGQALMHALLAQAQALGYRACYLETLSTMSQARVLYTRNGFVRLDAPMGMSGHNACDEWYLLAFDEPESAQISC